MEGKTCRVKTGRVMLVVRGGGQRSQSKVERGKRGPDEIMECRIPAEEGALSSAAKGEAMPVTDGAVV